MKKISYFILLVALLMSTSLRADEGMWLPSLISERIADMQAKGFTLSAEDIYSINQASLKDAVVHFGGGCTGELISGQGLLITNHHCGYRAIQKHSSVEHDYLKDGFWAMSQAEELPNEDLSVSFLVRMEDVTKDVLAGYDESMTTVQRDSVVKVNSKAIIKSATEEGKGLKASVEALYYGNQYFMFLFREYTDVRLVGAPPSSIGKFGGDTDNWMWPRHTGDFSLFRVYADKDNMPSEYSENNIPYIPRKFFTISTKGVNEGDFTFVYGFPGRTSEYIHSSAVDYIQNMSNPAKINLRTQRLNVQKKYMSLDQAVRIQYSAKNASVSNAWKKWQGEKGGLARLNTVAKKKEFEKEFATWAKGGEYEGVLEKLDSLYCELKDYKYAMEYFTESANTVELSKFAMSVVAALKKGKDVKPIASSFYKDYYMPIDKESFIAVMNSFKADVPQEFVPEYFSASLSEYGSIEAWAEYIFSNSLFLDKQNLSGEVSDSLLQEDAAYQFGFEMSKYFRGNVYPIVRQLESEIFLTNRDYMKGQMAYDTEKNFYPDANSTLRVAYGKVSGYSPADGIQYYHYSTLDGIIEKDNPEIFDYNIPQKLRDIYAQKNFGRFVDNRGKVAVCFIANNHTSGGNSGSPVINKDGHLIGVNFDRVWEGTMSDVAYDPAMCRNISLDIRYVMFIIDKLAGAEYLFNEMKFD